METRGRGGGGEGRGGEGRGGEGRGGRGGMNVIHILMGHNILIAVKGMLHWRKYTTFTLLCINSIIY